MLQHKLLIKGEKFQNPKTMRWCKLGGPLFKKLIRDKVIYEGSSSSDNQVVYEGEDAADVMKRLNIPLPEGKTLYMRGGKIMTRDKRISAELIKEKSQMLGRQIYLENPHLFTGLSPSKVQQKILELIGEKMTTTTDSRIKREMTFIIDNIAIDGYESSDLEIDEEEEVEEEKVLEDAGMEDTASESESESDIPEEKKVKPKSKKIKPKSSQSPKFIIEESEEEEEEGCTNR